MGPERMRAILDRRRAKVVEPGEGMLSYIVSRLLTTADMTDEERSVRYLSVCDQLEVRLPPGQVH